MENFITQRMNEDLNNPNSPYYLGQPSSIDIINNYVYGNGRYFGANCKSFLAQPTRDTLQILKNAKSDHEKNLLHKWGLGSIATIAGLLIARKIPVIKYIPRSLGWALGKLLGR